MLRESGLARKSRVVGVEAPPSPGVVSQHPPPAGLGSPAVGQRVGQDRQQAGDGKLLSAGEPPTNPPSVSSPLTRRSLLRQQAQQQLLVRAGDPDF